MNPYAFSALSIAELETGISEYIQKGHTPSLALVFSSVAFKIDEILEIFRYFKIEVFGASAAGEITNGKLSNDSISVLLLDISPDIFRINIFDRHGKSSFQTGREAGKWAKETFDDPVLLISSGGWDADGDQIIQGIKSVTDDSILISGGFAGNNLRPDKDTFAFGTSGILNKGIACLAFDHERIQLSGITVCGWKGIGTKKVITKSANNQVFNIDNQPALEVYQKYLEVSSNLDLSRSNETGLMVERPDGSIVMRAALRINEDKSILFGGSMPEGARIRFCISSGSEVVSQSIEQLKKFHEEIKEADAGVLFSCISRLQAVGAILEKETMAISDIWKVPYAGFFTIGEFGPGSTGRSDFHNFTLSLVLLKEK